MLHRIPSRPSESSFPRAAFAAVAILGVPFLAAACGAPGDAARDASRDGGPDARPRIFGSRGLDSASPETWATVGLSNGCSGTLIGPRVVVSARHCVTGRAGKPARVVFGRSLKEGQGVPVEDIVTIPGARGRGDDVALLFLDRDAPALFRPVALLPAGEPLREGERVTVAGFGRTERGSSGRLGATEVVLEVMPTAASPIVGLTGHDGGACNGDSGGPAYVRRGATWYLVGATSGPITGASRCGNETVAYAFVPAHAAWIRSEARARGRTIGGAGDAPGAVPGKAYALRATWLTTRAAAPDALPAGEKCLVPEGTVLAYRARVAASAHAVLDLRFADVSCPDFPTRGVHVQAAHWKFSDVAR